MTKELLVSVVDDDRFFRESMRRLMRSLAYTAEDFASAADFLESPRLAETACLIADVNMPAMTLNASVVVSFFENGQLNLTKLFKLEDLNRDQVDILRNFKGRLH